MKRLKKYNSLQLLDTYVRDNYFGKIDETELNDGILKGYVAGLDDKYSRYLSAENILMSRMKMQGSLLVLG